jgi:NADH-quinone oxidoreductase subunit E
MSRISEEQREFTLSAESRERIATLRERYPTAASTLMPAIWVIQDEHGWVSSQSVDYLVEALGVTRARVYELLTFYTMFRTEPQAEYVLQVCHNICCHVLGARSIIAHLERRLGIRLGARTPDGKFQLEGAECLGACGHGPMLQLGKHFYENLTPEKVDALLEDLKKGVVPRADTDRVPEDCE